MTPNTPKFEQFKAKRESWIECLSGKDRNSIRNQLLRMIWNAAAYRVVNGARRIAPPAKEGGVQLNGLMHRVIDVCFFDSQLAGIRRLTDTYPLTGERAVYSLTGLMEDMRENAHLMTRENIFAAEELAYDYEPIRKASEEYAMEQGRAGNRACFVPPHLNWHRPAERHREIDRLAGVAEDSRSGGDAVRPEVLNQLEARVKNVCENAKAHVDKFVAHAGTPESRESVIAGKLDVTLGHLWDAHEVLCKVANFIDWFLLTGSTSSFLRTPEYDHLAYIEKPLVTRDQIKELHEVWHR